MTPEDVVLASVNTSMAMVGSENLARLARANMEVIGHDLAARTTAEDKPGPFVPLEVRIDGKWQPGCVLTLQDRAIVAWLTGTFRVKRFAEVIPLSEVEKVQETVIEPAARLQPERGVVEIRTARTTHSVRVIRKADNFNLVDMLVGALLGAITFTD